MDSVPFILLKVSFCPFTDNLPLTHMHLFRAVHRCVHSHSHICLINELQHSGLFWSVLENATSLFLLLLLQRFLCTSVLVAHCYTFHFYGRKENQTLVSQYKI